MGTPLYAYGMAGDTPGQLRNLVSSDAERRTQAVGHLFGALLHQGTIYSATPAAVRVVAGILREPLLRVPLDNGDSTLKSALVFLGEVGASLNAAGLVEPQSPPSEADLIELFRQLRADDEDEEKGWGSDLIEVLMGQAVIDLRGLVGDVLAAVAPFVSDAAADVRRNAINTIAQWGAVQPGSEPSGAASRLLAERLATIEGRDERAALVLALGMLGRDVSPWRDDPDEAVRTCAALFVHDQRATALLVTALSDPARVNDWFEHRPAYFPMHARFTLLGELIARQVTIEAMLPAALALIAGSSVANADAEWGRILQVAFPVSAAAFRPGQRPPSPVWLTDAQRAVLEGLVANEALWDPRSGNARLARMRVGLSDVRQEVADYCRSAPAA